jgi:molybdate transport system ATP-binding protein
MTLEVDISHQFATFEVRVRFAAPGGITALFGPSGAGKTTIINAVAGLLTPRSGRIAVNGETLFDTANGINIPTHQRRVGYVFQDARLFPHLTVRQNLTFGRRFSSASRPVATFERIVDLLGIVALLDRRPATLSGGERQRVAIGRALLANPRILLMDEPLAALDEDRKAEILPYLERLRDNFDVPVLYVSHAVAEVARLATTIVVINEGRVVRQGAAAEVLADPDAFPMMGRQEAGSILTARVARRDAGDGLSELSFSGGVLTTPQIDAPEGTRLRVRIRARDIILATQAPDETSALNILPAAVRQIGNQTGAIVDIQVRAGDDDLLARITRRSLNRLGLSVGDPCFAILKSIAVARRDVGQFEERGD